MLVHPLFCNDDRAGEIGSTFHFMTRHDLVLANDRLSKRGVPISAIEYVTYRKVRRYIDTAAFRDQAEEFWLKKWAGAPPGIGHPSF